MATRGCFFVLNLLYGVGSVAVLLTGVVLQQYEAVQQAVLASVVLLAWGLLVGMEPRDGRVKRSARVCLCATTFVALVFLGLAAIEPLTVLTTECPQLHHLHLHSAASTAPPPLRVTVEYAQRDEATGALTPQLLLLEYDEEGTRLTRRERPGAAAATDETWLERESARYRLQAGPLCADVPAPGFRLLAHEVETGLRAERAAAEARPSMRVSSHGADDGGYGVLFHWRQRLRVREICEHEYGAAILWLVFLAALGVLQLFTLLWYAFSVGDEGPTPQQ